MLWLDPIPSNLRGSALAALAAGDVVDFLVKAGNTYSLKLVYRNIEELRARGLYETALLRAFVTTRTNNHGWPISALRLLFDVADRGRLRSAGDRLPGPGPFTLYRGVAGHGRARRVRGLSWTASLERARFFAHRFDGYLAAPAVFSVTVQEHDVLAYSNDRTEQEFIVMLPPSARLVRVELPGEQTDAANTVSPNPKGQKPGGHLTTI